MTDTMTSSDLGPDAGRRLPGSGGAVRALKRFAGVSLTMLALVLVLLPLGTGSTAALLCKIMGVLVLAAAGLGLWQAGGTRAAPEVEIDTHAAEIRVVRWQAGQRQVLEATPFRDIARAESVAGKVRLWLPGGEILTEIDTADCATRVALLEALAQSGVRI